MSHPIEFDGPRLHSWASRAVAELSAQRDAINALNVFPVPDSDTGSNMTHTMQAALAEVETLPDSRRDDIAEVTKSLAVGSVRGARGNSGVVLSQVLRGLSEAAVHERVDASVLTRTLEIAVTLVNRAIADPVEGTVVTVLRAAAVAARHAVDEGADLRTTAAAAVDAARIALAQTPSQLEVLREAGVVDAGGAGLVILLETLSAEIEGAPSKTAFSGWSDSVAGESPVSHGSPGELEVMFYFQGDLDALAATIDPLGDSLLIARAAEDAGTVHIHTSDAGTVIEAAYGLGAVSRLRLEVLPGAPKIDQPARLIVALTPPGEIASLYRRVGAEVVEIELELEEDADYDPVGEILGRIRASGADEIILLPNGLLNRRQLAAVDKATHAFDQSITLLPTSRLVSGLAALTVHDSEQPLATSAYAMSEAASAMRTAVAVRAERAALTSAGACAKGDLLVEAHGQILQIAETIDGAVLGAAKHLLGAGGEQISVITDADLDPEALSEALHVDVMVYPGEGLGVTAEIGVE